MDIHGMKILKTSCVGYHVLCPISSIYASENDAYFYIKRMLVFYQLFLGLLIMNK